MKKCLTGIMCVLLLAGCSPQEEVTTIESTKRVEVTQINPESVTQSLTLSGNVVPVNQASVSFKVAGVIDRVYVKEGDSVRAGDKIASLKSNDYELQVQAAQAAVSGATAQEDTARAGVETAQAQAQAALTQIDTAQASIDAAISARDTAQLQIDTEIPSKIEQARQQLELTQTNYDNIKAMYEAGVATKNQYDEVTTQLAVTKEAYNQALDAKALAESQLNAAQAQIEAAQSAKATAQATYDGAMAQVNAALSTTSAATAQKEAASAQASAADNSLKDTVIYSPVSGVVLKKVMNSGETVAAGTPIVVVGTDNSMWVRVGVPDSYINSIREGQRAVIHVYGIEEPIEGRVDEIGALADTTTRTFTVNILADNSANLLKSGMICTCDIIFSEESKVLVPVDSVISLPEGESVYILEGDTVRSVPVTTGDITGDRVEVLTGLNPGDSLVTEGQFVVYDGERVTWEVKEND